MEKKEVKKGAIRPEIAWVGCGVDLLSNAPEFWQGRAAG
jgi:hypothetical protein